MSERDVWRRRFEQDVIVMASGCWDWLGRIDKTGYGRTSYGKPLEQLAHRLAYRLWNGEIPPGLTIDHLCRNRRCINPAHLEAGTARENILRGDGMAARRARQTHCKRGHAFTPENTYLYSNRRRECITCRTARGRRRSSARAA